MHPFLAAIAYGLGAFTAPQPSEATLLFAGDAMQHQSQLDAARRGSVYDYSECFAAVAPLVSEADYAVVNLETPLAGAPYSGYPMFNAPDAFAVALQDAGFDMMLTANNHTLDRRDRGLRRTADFLDGRGIDHLGTYRSAASRDSVLPLIKDINGFRVGFLNYTYGTNGISVTDNTVVDYINRDRMRRDIDATRGAGAELVCVAVHWGDEYKLLPNSSQRSTADMLVDAGADLVIGGHPHVIQPMEMRVRPDSTKVLVVYSLGNFISGMRTRDTRGGAIVRARLARDDSGRAVVESADYDLVFTQWPGGGIGNFNLVYTDSCSNPEWQGRCREFERAATGIFDKHNRDVPRRPRD